MRTLPGAAEYINEVNLVTCKRCGCSYLAWTKSKNGKNYLCHTMPSRGEQRYTGGIYVKMPWQPHSCEAYLKRKKDEENERNEIKTLREREVEERIKVNNQTIENLVRKNIASEKIEEYTVLLNKLAPDVDSPAWALALVKALKEE